MNRVNQEEFNMQLEQRTLDFSVAVVNALDNLPSRPILRVIVVQLAKSATSIGANYREANRAESKADFSHKVAISCKEASETLYWLDILLRLKFLTQAQKESLKYLRAESSELLALFRSISRSLKHGQRQKSILQQEMMRLGNKEEHRRQNASSNLRQPISK